VAFCCNWCSYGGADTAGMHYRIVQCTYYQS
ncbi:MAG TPA: hydrogenase iron-sulfur subunit, partial [Armatimonadetes bacterium]|nr:hydrogenase iron-sulfur subunit [Armatimonadota bacterium]